MDRLLDKLYILLASAYLKKGDHKLVVVAGSVGKTSTTQAIAKVLSNDYNVRTTIHNYNTKRGVAMTILNQRIPLNKFAWGFLIVSATIKVLCTKPKFNMLVLELGTDAPGDMQEFTFLHADLAVLTAVAPEHMEFFKTLDAVAKEEIFVSNLAPMTFVQADFVKKEDVDTYGHGVIEYVGNGTNHTVLRKNNIVTITHPGKKIESSQISLVGRSGMSVVLLASTVGHYFGMDQINILKGLESLQPVAGRMNILRGKNGSVLIDDTYNASPEAMKVALDYLYEQPAKKRIALLGTMNEMGEESKRVHTLVGSWCDPAKLDLLVTLGADANEYIANQAELKGCRVLQTVTPKQAGEIILGELTEGTVVLAKGSQNAVYAEEALKILLDDPRDQSLLVRQHSYWPEKKKRYFVELDEDGVVK